jgi:signal transduction histidine kinase
MIKNNVNINNKNNKKKMMMMNDDGGGGGGGGAKTNMEDIGHVNMRENPTKKKSST